MKSLEQRMNRFSWACAAMLVLGGVGASGQAAAACEFVDGENPGYWRPVFDFGVIRIGTDNSEPAPGEPLSDWVEVSGILRCTTADSYRLRGNVASNGRTPVTVQVEGKTYATVDSAIQVDDPDLGIGFITEVEIGSNTYPVSSVGTGGAPGPVFNNTTLPDGDIPFVARRRLVGLGLPIQEGVLNPGNAMVPRLYLEEISETAPQYVIGATPNVVVIYQVASCAPTGIDQEVQVGPFSLSSTPGPGMPWPQEKEFGFTIDCPSSTSPINVYALFTDNANPDNTGEALTLTGDDIPAGVELRLFQESDTAIKFGPESAETNAPGAFRLFTAPANVESTEQVSFKAKLFQTGPGLSAGEINAAARVTLTYD